MYQLPPGLGFCMGSRVSMVDMQIAKAPTMHYTLCKTVLRNLQGNKFRIRSKVLSDTVHCAYRSVERGQTDWEVENKIKVLVSNDWQPQISKQRKPLTTLRPQRESLWDPCERQIVGSEKTVAQNVLCIHTNTGNWRFFPEETEALKTGIQMKTPVVCLPLFLVLSLPTVEG